jgi:TonB-linked SusC/RagA family outer membrane protein
MLCILGCSLVAHAQKRVTGTVTDANSEPIIGANVVEKGTTNGIVTDLDGKFSLTVPDNAVLQISYIGYVSQEIAVRNQTSLKITLKEDNLALEEVVIVGYGVQRKVTLTGSVATVPAKDIVNIPVANLSEALSGKMPGVKIQQPFGTPGSTSSLAVRATGTWNNADPLYVIDGIVRDKFAFDGLNANDIDGLSVLKDAAAAVYGARAANGVVLVTTKKGTSGKPVISYNGSISMSDPTKISPSANAYEHANLYNDWLEQQNIDVSDGRWFTQDELEYYKTHNWDWLDMALRNPVINHHSLNVTGGNERVRYFIGGSYHYETGIFDNINYQTYNLRGNIEANITKDLIASLNLNMDNRQMGYPDWRYDSSDGSYWNLFRGLMTRPSFVPPYVDGLAIGSPFVDWHAIELFSGRTGYDRRKYGNYEATLSLQYNIPFVEGLSVKLLYNKYDSYYFKKLQRLPYKKYQFRMTGGHNHIVDLENPEVVLIQTRNDGNLLQEREQMDFNYQLNGFITYNRLFGKHDVGALFVYEQAEGTTDWFQAERQNYVTGIIDQLDAGGSTPAVIPTGNGSETGRISYIGRLNYGFDNKYLLEASFRYDGSVRFAPDKRWGLFPSALAAWRMAHFGRKLLQGECKVHQQPEIKSVVWNIG